MSSEKYNFEPRQHQWGSKVEDIFVQACNVRLQRYLTDDDVVLSAMAAREEACLDNVVPPSTCYRWYTHWEAFDEAPYQTRERWEKVRRKLATSKKGRRKRKHSRVCSKMTLEVKEALADIIDQDPLMYLEDIQTELLVRAGVEVSFKTIWYTLVDDLNYSLGVYSRKALQQDAREREEFKQKMESLVTHADQIIWIDETDKGENASRRRRGWKPKGKRVRISQDMDPSGNHRYTMIAAANVDGFVVGASELIQRDKPEGSNDEYRGTVDGT